MPIPDFGQRAALLQSHAGEQCRHADRRVDAFDHRNTELLLQPRRVDVNRALADAHGINHFGPFGDQTFGFADEIVDDLVVMRCQIRQVESAHAEADDALFHPVAPDDRS